MAEVLFDDVVKTDYGQLDICWGGSEGFDGDDDWFFGGQVNGLVGAASGDGMYIRFARRAGGSPLRIVLHNAEPPASDTASLGQDTVV